MEASGIIGSESKDLRTKGADDLNASLRAGEDEKRYPSSNHEAGKKRHIPPSSGFLFWLRLEQIR